MWDDGCPWESYLPCALLQGMWRDMEQHLHLYVGNVQRGSASAATFGTIWSHFFGGPLKDGSAFQHVTDPDLLGPRRFKYALPVQGPTWQMVCFATTLQCIT
jgi:hypothetical protein